MEPAFDLKATIAHYTANLRKLTQFENNLSTLVDTPDHISISSKMIERGFYDTVNSTGDMQISVKQWEIENREFLMGLDQAERGCAQNLLDAAKDIKDARFEKARIARSISDHFGFKNVERNTILNAQLKHIDSVIHTVERAAEGNALSDVQKNMVAEHINGLVVGDLQHMVKLKNSELNTYKIAPTTSAIYMQELNIAFTSKGNSFIDFVNDFQKNITATEKPVGSPRNWIIGGVVAAVVAVGAWMLAANQKPAERHEVPAR